MNEPKKAVSLMEFKAVDGAPMPETRTRTGACGTLVIAKELREILQGLENSSLAEYVWIDGKTGERRKATDFVDTEEERQRLCQQLRNLIQKAELQARTEKPSKSNAYPVQASQEYQSLMHLFGDAKSFGQRFSISQQGHKIGYKREGDTYRVEIAQTDEERDVGFKVEMLCEATRALDVDSAVIWNYISELLAPANPLPANTAAAAWIDLDDVAHRTLGGYAKDKKRAQRRAQVYHTIKYIARACVIGARSKPYYDKQTGQEIPTRLSAPPWQILGKQEGEAPGLWPELDVPLQVRLVASPEWTALTTNRDIAQWLPGGEAIGAIPGDQPGGAWARALGLSYMVWCRMNAALALGGQSPKRRALLDTHPPTKKPYTELLNTPHANRIPGYWATAESHLHAARIIEKRGHREKIVKGSGEWQEVWLNAPAGWQPGPALRETLEKIAAHKYLEKPRQLNPARRPGRPRKNARESGEKP